MKLVSLEKDQRGMVAIVVTLVFLIVISLTSLGLARLARREQRQAIDNQLSSEALYLAEAGINDAKRAINNPASIYHVSDKTTCAPTSPDFDNPVLNFLSPTSTDPNGDYLEGLLSISAEGSYSCVLIDHSPEDLSYPVVPTDRSLYADAVVENAGADYYLIISWQHTNDKPNIDVFRPVGNIDFLPMSQWVDAGDPVTGVMRLDISRITNSFDRNYLRDNTMSAYLNPNRGGATPGPGTDFSASIGPANNGSIVQGDCNAVSIEAKKCNVQINFNGATDSHIFLRLKMIYHPADVVIKAFRTVGNAPLEIKGAQTVIDSTGRAADVVKRVQVRVGTRPTDNSYPEYVVEGVQGICKRILAAPNKAPPAFDNSNVNAADTAVCNPQSN